MMRWVSIVVVGGIVALTLGMLIPAVLRLRLTSDRVRCQDHLREIASFGIWHATLPGETFSPDARKSIPAGTVPSATLPPTERLSWLVTLLPALEGKRLTPKELSAGPDGRIAWDAAGNAKLARLRMNVFLCPAQVPDRVIDQPDITGYFATAGLGIDAPTLTLPADGPVPTNLGAMRYDGMTPIERILDGQSQTILVAETIRDRGPWAQGGPSTLRGLDVADLPYLGPNRPFAGCHVGGGNFAFVDGSVRFLSEAITPAIMRAQLTIAGQEDVEFDRP